MSESVKRKVGRPRKTVDGGEKNAACPRGTAKAGKRVASAKEKDKNSRKKALSNKDTKEKKEILEQARRDDNAAVGICPFFKNDRGCGRVSCEGANFHFPDKEARREFVYQFCAHPEGYKTCPLQVALNHYYERKYDHHE